MFVAKWRSGPEAMLLAEIWVDAVQEALVVSALSPERDELLSIEWEEVEHIVIELTDTLQEKEL